MFYITFRVYKKLPVDTNPTPTLDTNYLVCFMAYMLHLTMIYNFHGCPAILGQVSELPPKVHVEQVDENFITVKLIPGSVIDYQSNIYLELLKHCHHLCQSQYLLKEGGVIMDYFLCRYFSVHIIFYLVRKKLSAANMSINVLCILEDVNIIMGVKIISNKLY